MTTTKTVYAVIPTTEDTFPTFLTTTTVHHGWEHGVVAKTDGVLHLVALHATQRAAYNRARRIVSRGGRAQAVMMIPQDAMRFFYGFAMENHGVVRPGEMYRAAMRAYVMR